MKERPKFESISDGVKNVYKDHIPVRLGVRTLISPRQAVEAAGLSPDGPDDEEEISDEAYEKLLESAIDPSLN